MKIILPSLAFIAGCSTTIHGVIRDKPTGNPLPSTSVAVGEKSAMTNAITAKMRLHPWPKRIPKTGATFMSRTPETAIATSELNPASGR